MILRLLLLGAGLVALVASLTIDRPERFALTGPSALVAFVVAAGAIAADAVPLRRLPLACSIATAVLALGLALLARRGDTQVPLAAGIVALQIVALTATLAARPGPRSRASSRRRSAAPRRGG